MTSTRYKKSAKRKRSSAFRNIFSTAVTIAIAYAGYNAVACGNSSNTSSNNNAVTNQNVEQHQQIDLFKVVTSKDLPQEMLTYKGMKISYNPQLHIPNYVVWELTRDEVHGTVSRKGKKFQADPNVKGCPDTYDYSNSGYDRGHMAPAGDMKWDETAMIESHYMTNICPQANDLNAGSWKSLEEKCRVWAEVDSAIIIICGPVLTDQITDYIGKSTKVAVPKRFFKVILSPYANPPRAIGFIMPNSHVDGGMQRAAVSVDEVERVTGYDFFPELPDDIENQAESQCKFNYWSNLH
jgi:endonuclease G